MHIGVWQHRHGSADCTIYKGNSWAPGGKHSKSPMIDAGDIMHATTWHLCWRVYDWRAAVCCAVFVGKKKLLWTIFVTNLFLYMGSLHYHDMPLTIKWRNLPMAAWKSSMKIDWIGLWRLQLLQLWGMLMQWFMLTGESPLMQ